MPPSPRRGELDKVSTLPILLFHPDDPTPPALGSLFVGKYRR